VGNNCSVVFRRHWCRICVRFSLGRIQNNRCDEAQTRSNEAKAEAERAKAEVARANEAIATATERTAELEKEAAEARAEQERLKAQLAWRTLSPNVLDRLVAGLTGGSGSVAIGYTQNDPEALAAQISKAFERANNRRPEEPWKIQPDPRLYSDRVLFGIFIPGLFTSSGIPFFTNDVPQPVIAIGGGGAGISIGGSAVRDDALIMIGSKAPPF
jgi:hypothetical protein